MTFFIPVPSLASFIIKVFFFYDPRLHLWYSALCCCHIWICLLRIRTPWLIWRGTLNVCLSRNSKAPGLATRSEIKRLAYDTSSQRYRLMRFSLLTFLCSPWCTFNKQSTSYTPKVIYVVNNRIITLGVLMRERWHRLPVHISFSLIIFHPLNPPPFSLSSQGMVYSAEYIKKKLEQEMILSQAFGRDLVHDSVYCVKYGRLNDDPFYKNLYSVFLLASL